MVAKVTHNQSCCDYIADGIQWYATRIFEAVRDFFNYVVNQIARALEYIGCDCWSKTEVQSGQGTQAISRKPRETLETKLARFKNMSYSPESFLREAVMNHNLEIEDFLSAYTKEDIAKDEDLKALAQFKKACENFDGGVFVEILKAAVRAYVFSDLPSDAAGIDHCPRFIREYMRTEATVERDYRGQVIGTVKDEVLKDIYPDLNRLKRRFNNLTPDEKEIVIGCLTPKTYKDSPPRVLAMIQEINAHAFNLVQKNDLFFAICPRALDFVPGPTQED